MTSAPLTMVEMIEEPAGFSNAANRATCSGFADSETPGYKRAMFCLRIFRQA